MTTNFFFYRCFNRCRFLNRLGLFFNGHLRLSVLCIFLYLCLRLYGLSICCGNRFCFRFGLWRRLRLRLWHIGICFSEKSALCINKGV